jgi:hypothetical protein
MTPTERADFSGGGRTGGRRVLFGTARGCAGDGGGGGGAEGEATSVRDGRQRGVR